VDEEDDDVLEEESVSSCPKLSAIRNHMDDVISYIGASLNPEVLAYYGHFKAVSFIIKKQHGSGKQLKIIHSSSLLVHSNLQLSSKLCQFVYFIRNKQKTNNIRGSYI
jgi:hypothetical protein